MKSKIILEGLKIYAFHGVLAEETKIGNYFILDLELSTDLSRAANSDALEDTINYAEINDLLHEEMKTPSKLLEHVAGRIIKKITDNYPKINYIKLKIGKTNPPMMGEIKTVSVEMETEF